MRLVCICCVMYNTNVYNVLDFFENPRAIIPKFTRLSITFFPHYLHPSILLARAIVAWIFSCSSKEDSPVLKKPYIFNVEDQILTITIIVCCLLDLLPPCIRQSVHEKKIFTKAHAYRSATVPSKIVVCLESYKLCSVCVLPLEFILLNYDDFDVAYFLESLLWGNFS